MLADLWHSLVCSILSHKYCLSLCLAMLSTCLAVVRSSSREWLTMLVLAAPEDER